MGLFGNKKHSIGKTIALLRKEKGWTQIELAEKLQVSDKAISKWEKDNGSPSVEFFPALSELFGVSIDYLMTGKNTEPKIITMSKAELCAKNDDSSMSESIDIFNKDENGKTLLDYIIQYKSYNVFTTICDKDDFINHQQTFDVLTLIKFALITNKISVLDRLPIIANHSIVDIKSLLHIDDLNHFKNAQGSTARNACVLTDELLDIVVLDKHLNEKTISYLLSKQKGRECVWYLVLPYLLHQSYLHNNSNLFTKILDVAISNNKYAYEKMPITYDRQGNCNYELKYYMVSSEYRYGIFGLVRILEKTIKLALERSDIEVVERLNAINTDLIKYDNHFKCYIATDDEMRIAKLKLNKNVSKDEIKLQSTIHNGIVSIDELLKIGDFKIIKNALDRYPVHQFELLYSMFKEQNWRGLFQIAVDEGDNLLAQIIIDEEFDDIQENLLSYWNGKKAIYYNGNKNINRNLLYYIENGKKIELFSYRYNHNSDTVDTAIKKIHLCKQRIVEELTLKMDKDKTISELTKEYFETELEKGNAEMVIIKLCVRLEAILRCDYLYEGDFKNLLDKYCEQLTIYDDEGYAYENNEAKILNKLRMQRNSIVHSEKCNEQLTLDEIKWCIDHICKLG